MCTLVGGFSVKLARNGGLHAIKRPDCGPTRRPNGDSIARFVPLVLNMSCYGSSAITVKLLCRVLKECVSGNGGCFFLGMEAVFIFPFFFRLTYVCASLFRNM